ncbi:MAG: hypothetical protein IT448_03960 [Phycisphaerales bacterium]|nr:hypothetical protein [Phycisphaerales bacterium]
MLTKLHTFPPLPEIGHPEIWYAKRIRQADDAGDTYLRQSLKVGQYITLGLDPLLSWEDKHRYFCHAIKRHCQPPPLPDEATRNFYGSLAALVREYAGREVLRLASIEDDIYAARQTMGQSEEEIENDAEIFFARLIPDECPDYLDYEDYEQLKIIRDQWI